MNSDSRMISYASLTRSGRVLKAFSLLYLRFYDLSIDVFFSKFGLWTFVEAMAYEADESNECARSSRQALITLQGIKLQLRNLGLFDQKCAAELENAKQYFKFERLLRKSVELSIDQVLAAATLRSFDFRLLHRLLWKTQGWPYDENIFQAFHVFEQVMEFDDDYNSIDKDTRARTFNVCAGLGSIGNDWTNQYREKLRHGVNNAAKRFGKNYQAMLDTYYALVPLTILKDSKLVEVQSSNRRPQVNRQKDTNSFLGLGDVRL